MLLSQFPSYSQRDAAFHRIAYDYYHANKVLLLLLVNFVSGFRLKLMYISLVQNIRSSLIRLYGFQLLVLLP